MSCHASGHTLQASPLQDKVVSPTVQLRAPYTSASEVLTIPAMRLRIIGQLASDSRLPSTCLFW